MSVPFAGMRFTALGNLLTTRCLNAHCEYDDVGVAAWKITRARFVAGREHGTRKGKVGQLMGHIARILDSSNAFSAGFVPMDLCLLLWELEASGWERRDFFVAFERLVYGAPNLMGIYQATQTLVEGLRKRECDDL